MTEEIREEQINLLDYVRVLMKRRWTIVSVFVAVVLFVAVHTFTSVPIFQASARIVIEKENPNLVSIQEVMAVDSTGTDYYQTQYKIIESRAVARDVIKKLDLNSSPEFFPEPDDSVIATAKRWIRDQACGFQDWLKSLIQTGDKMSDPPALADSEIDPDSGLVNSVISRINVQPIRNSRLVDVLVEAKDPVMAARMANTVVHSYIDKNLETKLKAAKDGVKWLSDRIDEERLKVEEAENALLRYKEKNEIITDFSSDAEKITAQKLASLNEQVVGAESSRVEAETRYRQAMELEDSPDMLDSIPEVLSNPLIGQIKAMEVQLYNRMSELSKKYGRNHPQMVAIDAELADLQKRKNREIQRVVNSLRNEYKLALAREESLKQSLSRQKKESLQMNQKAVQYGVLQRQAESSRNMYELLVKRFKETSLTEEMKTGNIRIVDRAEVPRNPVKPNKKLNLLLALVVGLMLGIGLAFFLEYLDNTIKLPDEVKDYLKIPYLGPLPVFASDEKVGETAGELFTIHSPKSTASELFRGIRTGILFSSVDKAHQVILVTSAGPYEGKTTCASNLAITMAQSGSRVIVVDCDLRRPRVHKFFRIARDIGLSSVLSGSSELKNAIVSSSVENLDLIPSGPIPPNPAEVLGSKKMSRFIEVLKKNYDCVIIDSPPISAVTDSVILSQLADGVVLIIRSGGTPKQVVRHALSQLQSVNAHILGAVLNGVSTGKDSYYYYQYYYYYYGEDGERKKKTNRRKKRTESYQ
ncbi:MAG: polysaccharide biosynthesis tyrosine autokinase [Desulfobacterales bacterium]|nr:polysaccharide biosynthesis tyrosine autokinase [Desulfobacterales bacterium]MDD4394080.1 polysaccharide biosynthesis tyrosine autokinase [Desulfobacterales bacterium]